MIRSAAFRDFVSAVRIPLALAVLVPFLLARCALCSHRAWRRGLVALPSIGALVAFSELLLLFCCATDPQELSGLPQRNSLQLHQAEPVLIRTGCMRNRGAASGSPSCVNLMYVILSRFLAFPRRKFCGVSYWVVVYIR